MASRNKKGKIHGIFKSEFHISFFHKPTSEETDIYYYIVLEDSIFIKMRLLYGIVLVIDELYPLTTSYMSPMYERIFNLLKTQTAVTVIVSLIGNAAEFRQTCLKFDAPIIDDDRFVGCSQNFYTKYKNYCGNSVERYGFFLIALKDETFSVIENAIEDDIVVENPTIIEEKHEEKLPQKIEQPKIEDKPDITKSNLHPMIEDLIKGISVTRFGTVDISINDNIYTLTCVHKNISMEFIIFEHTIQSNPIKSNSVGDIMDLIRIMSNIIKRCNSKLYFVNIAESDISHSILSMEYMKIRYFPQELKNTFVNPRLEAYFIDN